LTSCQAWLRPIRTSRGSTPSRSPELNISKKPAPSQEPPVKTAIEAANQALSSAQNPPCKTFSPSTARSLAYVWARMAGRYGALWTNSHGEAPGKVDMGEWGEVVGGLTEDQIREGFAADLRRRSDFPPSSSR